MASDEARAGPGVDTDRANPARVYDYWLGGSHNYLADQDLGRAIAAVDPVVREGSRANRAFLGRAVRFLAGAGIRQFLDIGSGIPAQGNVHEIAQQADPAARVVYADIDPIVIAHARALLAGNASADIIAADLRHPAAILGDPATRALIDFSQPAALLMVAVLHFIPDSDHPWQRVAELTAALAPGSYLVIGQGTCADKPATATAFEKIYNTRSATSIHMRSRDQIARFFAGLDLVDPGLTYVTQWRPDSPADVAPDPRIHANLVGVARKP
jgi:hypothetical protein